MSVSIYILFIITGSMLTINGQSKRSSDQLMPLLLSSVINNEGNVAPPPSRGQNRLLYIIGHIMKYVSTIKSSEDFIDDIINRQEEVSDKLKILKFLNNCFRMTNTLIQREIDRSLDVSHPNQKSFFLSPFTLEQLQEARIEINHLLQVIEDRTDRLRAWIPPTMPFLNF